MTKIGTNVRMSQTEKYFGKYLNKSTKVIDIGAGNGYISQYLVGKFKCKMHCSDIIDYMECDIPFTLIKNNKLPFKENAFDIAIMNDVLHHMPPKIQAIMLKEATRIAKKLLIVETDRKVVALILDTVFSRIQCFSMPIPYTHKSSNNWKKLFAEIGLSFKEEKVKKDWYYPLHHLFFAVSKNVQNVQESKKL